MSLDECDIDSDDNPEFEDLGTDDIEVVAAFYERTGVMPVNSIGPPIDRPIIPSRRPDHVGDFAFTTKTSVVPAAQAGAEEAEDPKSENIREEFVDMLKGELKGI